MNHADMATPDHSKFRVYSIGGKLGGGKYFVSNHDTQEKAIAAAAKFNADNEGVPVAAYVEEPDRMCTVCSMYESFCKCPGRSN